MDKLVTPSKPENFYEYNDKLIKIPDKSLYELSDQENILKLIFEYLLISTTRKDRNNLLLTNKKIYKWVCEIDPYSLINNIFSGNKIETISSAIIFGKLEHYPKTLTTTLDTKFLLNDPTNYDNSSFQSFKKECLLNYPVDLEHVKNTKEAQKLINIIKEKDNYINELNDTRPEKQQKNKFFTYINTVNNDISSVFKIYPKLKIEVSEENDLFSQFTEYFQYIVILLINRFKEIPVQDEGKLLLDNSITRVILLRYALNEKYQQKFNKNFRDHGKSLDLQLEEETNCNHFEVASTYKLDDSLKNKLYDSEGFLLYYFYLARDRFARHVCHLSERILNNTEFCLKFFREEDIPFYQSWHQGRNDLCNEIMNRSLGNKKVIIERCKRYILESKDISYERLPQIFKNDIECLLHCLKNYNRHKKTYKSTLFSRFPYNTHTSGKWGLPGFNLLSEELKQNPQIFNACKEIFMEDLEMKRGDESVIPYEFFSNRECILAYIKYYPQKFKKLSDKLKDDEAIAKMAIIMDPSEYHYASQRVKNIPEIAALTVVLSGKMREYIPKELQETNEFIKAESDEREKKILWEKNNSPLEKRKLSLDAFTHSNEKKQKTDE
jgi:hypothetical protein